MPRPHLVKHPHLHIPEHPLAHLMAPFAIFTFALIITTLVSSSFTPAFDSSATNTDLSVTVNPSLSLVVDNGSGGTDVSMDASASSFGSLLKAGVSVRAGSNNETGYTLTFSDTDEDNDLVEESNSALTIPALTATSPESSFPADKWGYSLDGGDYAAVPLQSAPLTLDQTDAPGDSTHTVNFATKISNDTASGTYKDSTVFSLVANYVPPVHPYIQDEIATWCAAQPTPSAFEQDGTTINVNVPETIMIDKRDNEEYAIRKLADGNCWMAENLRLGKGDRTYSLTPADSNVAADYTLPQGSTNNWGTNNNVEGVYVRDDRNTTNYGNLYSWQTATAGTGSSVTAQNQNAPSSICPKGMVLPLSGSTQIGTGSFYHLLTTTYGLASNTDGANKLQASPLEYKLAGEYYNGSLNDVGSRGFYWSRTVSSSTSPYHIYFSSSGVYPLNNTYRDSGNSIRCVTPPTLSSVSGQYIQDVDMATVCTNTPTPSAFESDGTTINANVPEAKMKDKRDDEEYTIRKLADGNCWMTQNLRLGKAGTTYAINSTLSDTTTSFNLPAAAASGSNSYDTLQVWSQNETNRQTYGNYYNWYTATAQTGTQSVTSGDATGSICPKGMKLPLGNTANGSFYNLLILKYGVNGAGAGAITLNNPLSFLLAGYYNSGFRDQESYGYYCSRTAHDSVSNSTYGLNIRLSDISPRTQLYKNLGFSVRCLTPGGN